METVTCPQCHLPVERHCTHCGWLVCTPCGVTYGKNNFTEKKQRKKNGL